MSGIHLGLSFHDAICAVLEAIANPSSDDPIHECDTFLKKKLLQDPGLVLKQAETHMRSVYPYKDVKMCWRRLFTDAAIVKAVFAIIDHCQLSNSEPWGIPYHHRLNLLISDIKERRNKISFDPDAPFDDWLVKQVIHTLDFALIMTGIPGREREVHGLFDQIQRVIEENEANTEAQKWSDSPNLELPMFSQTSVNRPDIKNPVLRVRNPSLDWLVNHLTNVRTPFVVEGECEHWPARSGENSWASSKFWWKQTLKGHRLIPVELGKSYTAEGWGQKITEFGNFARWYLWNEEEMSSYQESSPGRPQDYSPNMFGYQSATHWQPDLGNAGVAYLAQHDLLAQIPALRKDICVPDMCHAPTLGPEPGTPVYEKAKRERAEEQARQSAGAEAEPNPTDLTVEATEEPGYDSDFTPGNPSEPIINTWIGPEWTVTPLHHDPYHNAFCQVVGSKYIRLYSPHTPAEKIHPRGLELFEEALDEDPERSPRWIDMSNTSLVNIEDIELSPAEAEEWEQTWPGFQDLEYLDTVLEEGDCLYIPIGWWHYVRALRAGVSVSFWWNKEPWMEYSDGD
ncbi:JmjC domain protein [Penicillium herquei]|nr:JmjC domain protein [Penicillium herquei]